VSGGRSTPHSDTPPSGEHPKLDPYTLDEHNREAKPFTWTADLDKIVAAAKRDHQALDSIH
jgi:hypothetical protein